MINMNEDEIDTWQTDNPTCPYCGYEYQDMEGFIDGTDGKEQCVECGKLLKWEAEYSVSFFTKKLTGWKNGKTIIVIKCGLHV